MNQVEAGFGKKLFHLHLKWQKFEILDINLRLQSILILMKINTWPILILNVPVITITSWANMIASSNYSFM